VALCWDVASFVRSNHRSDRLPNGQRIPIVRVERLLSSGSCCWARQLVEVQDDLESRYLAAQRSKLNFALTVPNHGTHGSTVIINLHSR
jgi:hypothetical protein